MLTKQAVDHDGDWQGFQGWLDTKYHVGADGCLHSSKIVDCISDQQAVERAFSRGWTKHDLIEVWQDCRLVGHIDVIGDARATYQNHGGVQHCVDDLQAARRDARERLSSLSQAKAAFVSAMREARVVT